MSLWIKICANTSLEDALLAAEAGADAVGFVFAPSPRRVTVEQVAAIVPHCRAELEKIGVFVDAAFDEIAETVEACGLTGVQLHFDAPAELPARCAPASGRRCGFVRMVHFGAERRTERADAQSSDRTSTRFWLIRAPPRRRGGTGVAFDWTLAATTLFQNAEARKCHCGGRA